MAGDPSVLIIGPRTGLIDAVRAMGVEFSVWSARKRRYPGARHVHVAEFAVGETRARREFERLKPHGPFTHVLAGGENSVVTASFARRALGARKSTHSMVLRCRDKLLMKRHMAAHEIPMTPFVAGDPELIPAVVAQTLGLPLVAKPRTRSGGRGLTLISGLEQLQPVLKRTYLLERFVDAPEVSVESFVRDGEICLTNITQYARKGLINLVPAEVSAATREELTTLNQRIIQAMNISWGMTHAEFYLTPSGVLFGEIALRPPGGYIMELLELAWGFDAWQAFVAVELDLPFAFPDTPDAHAAALIVHPGAGEVRTIHGLEVIGRLPATVSLKLFVEPGERIAPRSGSGDSVGRILLRTADRPALLDAVRLVEESLHFELND